MIALYMRISNDDRDSKESSSISNQRDLLIRYVADNSELAESNVIEICDDEYSGINFQRPGIKCLIEKVRRQEIKCIIVKDFSRLGRNYIEVGNYLEKIFPFFGVRFISINDNYDSDRPVSSLEGIEAALRTLIYDLYSKDLSKKIKSGINAKKQRGEFVAPRPPYGYKKCLLNKNAIEPDEQTSKVVKSIFKLAAEGRGCSKIAKILNEQGTPTRSGKSGSFWKRSDISEILKNETYTGIAVAYPVIVDVKTFKKANRKSKPYACKKGKASANSIVSLKGKVRCGACNYAMRRNGVKVPSYYCETPLVLNSPNCVKHPVSEKIIKEVVLATLKSHLSLLADATKVLTKNLPAKGQDIAKFNSIIKNANINKQELYEYYKDGKISKQEYLLQKGRLNNKIGEAKTNLEATKIRLNHSKEVKLPVQKLTFEIADALINTVIIHNAEQIEIRLKYKNIFNLL